MKDTERKDFQRTDSGFTSYILTGCCGFNLRGDDPSSGCDVTSDDIGARWLDCSAKADAVDSKPRRNIQSASVPNQAQRPARHSVPVAAADTSERRRRLKIINRTMKTAIGTQSNLTSSRNSYKINPRAQLSIETVNTSPTGGDVQHQSFHTCFVSATACARTGYANCH
jgi:hypothetical protein